MSWRVYLAAYSILIFGCASKDLSGSWLNAEKDLELYIHNTWPGPIDFIVAEDTIRYDILSEHYRNEFTYLILQPDDMRLINDHFIILEYSDEGADSIYIESYSGSATAFVLEIRGEPEPEYVFSETFRR